MAYPRPTLQTIFQSLLQDVATSGAPGTQEPFLPDSPFVAFVWSLSERIWELYGFIDYVSLQATPFTATDEYLQAWAILKGVLKNAATYAIGSMTLNGTSTNGTLIPAGAVLSYTGSNTTYTVNNDVFVSGGTATLGFTATTAGSIGNAGSGLTLTFQSPITNVAINGTAGPITGGSDIQSDDSLRTETLIKYAAPPQGGASSDYRLWTLQVPGVTRAWTPESPPDPGFVYVYFMMDEAESLFNGFPQGTNGGASDETRILVATGDQLAVANYIYSLRPVTPAVWGIAPIAQPISITINNLGAANTGANQTAITAAINAAFIQYGDPTGTPANPVLIYQSQITAAIDAAVPGLLYTLASPSSPITIATGHLPTINGDVSFNT